VNLDAHANPFGKLLRFRRLQERAFRNDPPRRAAINQDTHIAAKPGSEFAFAADTNRPFNSVRGKRPFLKLHHVEPVGTANRNGRESLVTQQEFAGAAAAKWLKPSTISAEENSSFAAAI
jgi:hypothetical protein